MKATISGKDFKKPSEKAVYWAQQLEAFTMGEVEIDYDELPNQENLEIPVFIIPEKAEFRQIKNILYATKFYEADTTVISRLAHLARSFGASIHCVHIDTTEAYSEFANVLTDEFSKIAADLEINFTNVCSDSVDEGLEMFLSNNKIDLVAMLLHKFKIPANSKQDTIRLIAYDNEIPLLLFPEKVLQD